MPYPCSSYSKLCLTIDLIFPQRCGTYTNGDGLISEPSLTDGAGEKGAISATLSPTRLDASLLIFPSDTTYTPTP